MGLDHKMLPFLARHCAWLITHYQVKSDGKTFHQRLRGRPYQRQGAEFVELFISRIREGCRHAQIGRQMELGLVAGKEPEIRRVLRWHFGRSVQVSIHLGAPREATLGRKMMTEMDGDPGNATAHHQDKPVQVRGEYITLERQIKYGGAKTCAACFGNAKVHSPNAGHDSRTLWTSKLH